MAQNTSRFTVSRHSIGNVLKYIGVAAAGAAILYFVQPDRVSKKEIAKRIQGVNPRGSFLYVGNFEYKLDINLKDGLFYKGALYQLVDENNDQEPDRLDRIVAVKVPINRGPENQPVMPDRLKPEDIVTEPVLRGNYARPGTSIDTNLSR